MRSRLVLVVGATSSLILVAFLVPLAVLVRTAAADRALATATVQAQSLASTVATASDPELRDAVDRANESYPTSVFLPDGRVIGPPVPRSAAVLAGLSGTSTAADTDEGREIVVAVAGLQGGTAAIRTYVSERELTGGVASSWTMLGLLGLCLLAVSLAVADRLARSLTRPLSAVAAVSHRLASGNLAARAEVEGAPEVRQVSAGLNLLAGRINELLTQERELVADLSHRLRTPLTALRIDLESGADPNRARLLADLDAVERTVDSVIHEANRPAREGVTAVCDAAEVVAERAAFWSTLADDQDRHIAVAVPPQRIPVKVARSDLSACIDALIGNVFRHTPEGCDLAIGLAPLAAGGARLVVSDSGPGLPAGFAQGRGASGAGSTGLGLDIARRTAEHSGGRLELGRSRSGGAAIAVVLGPPAAGPVRTHRRRGRLAARTRRGLPASTDAGG